MDKETFIKKVESIQQDIYRNELAKYEKMETTNSSTKSSGDTVQIVCRHCDSKLGSLSNLYQYLSSHFLNMDPDVNKTMEVVTDEKLHSKSFDGIEEKYHLRCRGKASTDKCLKKVGKLLKMKIDGENRQLATWTIEAIKLVSAEGGVFLPRKFVDIGKKFDMKQIYNETLTEMAADLPSFEDDI